MSTIGLCLKNTLCNCILKNRFWFFFQNTVEPSPLHMAGVNNVSTYDNDPENSNNTVEHTNNKGTTGDSDDNDRDSLRDVIDDELSKRLNDDGGTSADRVKYSVDIMLAAESAHSAAAERHPDDDVEYTDVKCLSTDGGGGGVYDVQKDASELMLLTEKRHVEETAVDPGVDSEDVLADPDPPEGQPPRVFTRPLPVDETDKVTELVFDTWTTVEEIARGTSAGLPRTDTNSSSKDRSTSDISPAVAVVASPNQECSDINAPAIVTNCVVSFCLTINHINELYTECPKSI